MSQQFILGVDTGGTFTDIVAIDEAGQTFHEKAFSTPHDPGEGVMAAIDNVARLMGMDRQSLLAQTQRFSHGTTVSTNALIQRAGARVGLLTTQGFEDTLVIGRGPMGRTGGLPYEKAMDFAHADPPQPLVPRSFVRGVRERVTHDGSVLVPLDVEHAAEQVRALVNLGVESLAVCLLWGFRNPTHEEQLREIVRGIAPDLPVSLSSRISPVLGEFERAMTTVVNAYIGPTTTRYIQRLADRLAAEGLTSPIQVMQSSGGSCPPARVADEAVAIVNSGPVGGLVAARELGRQLGIDNLITTDMGGTSFDVGLVHQGEHEIERAGFLDQGVPVQIAAARVVAIGAGGGSIAWTDGRRLFVGPRSAGAVPGPACYAQGEEPTVTDALVVLGILNPQGFFGGRKALDVARAEGAIRKHVAEPLGLSVDDAAAGIYEIVTARMADLVRKVTVESGFDPRQFSLVAYGGSGPAHCAYFGATLGIQEVVIPETSSVFSALGVALADVQYSYARSQPLPLRPTPETAATFDQTFADLEARALADMAAAGIPGAQVQMTRRLDLRYQGQMNEVTLTWERAPFTPESARAIRAAFEEHYRGRFGEGTTLNEAPLEIITFRVDAMVPTRKPVLQGTAAGDDEVPRPVGERAVHVRGAGRVPAAVYEVAALQPGHAVAGPAILERRDTTVWLPEGYTVQVDPHHHLRMRKGDARARG